MGKGLLYCDACGKQVPERELYSLRAESGEVHYYCKKCAPQGASAPNEPRPTPKPNPILRGAARNSGRTSDSSPVLPAVHPRHRTTRVEPIPSSRAAKFVLAGLIAVGVITTAFVLGRSSHGTVPPDPVPPTSSPEPNPPTPRADLPKETPDQAFEKLERYVQEHEKDPKSCLAEISRREKVLEGRPDLVAKLRELRQTCLDHQRLEGQTELRGRLEALEKFIASDSNLDQVGVVVRRFEDLVKDLSSAPDLLGQAQSMREAYVNQVRTEVPRRMGELKKKVEGDLKEALYYAANQSLEDFERWLEGPAKLKVVETTVEQEYRELAERVRRAIEEFEKGEHQVQPTTQKKETNLPVGEAPPVGQEIVVFDGKDMGSWHPVHCCDDAGEAWRLEEGQLIGESKHSDATDSTVRDFIASSWNEYTQYEISIKMKLESGFVGFFPRGGAKGIRIKKVGDWRTVSFIVRKDVATILGEGIPRTDPLAEETPPKGRIKIGLSPGAKAWIKEIKIKCQ